MARVTIEFDAFASTRLEQEAGVQGIAVDDLVRHAVMYYFADLDSGRASTRALPETRQANQPPQSS